MTGGTSLLVAGCLLLVAVGSGPRLRERAPGENPQTTSDQQPATDATQNAKLTEPQQ
jgi:hypothetical protein